MSAGCTARGTSSRANDKADDVSETNREPLEKFPSVGHNTEVDTFSNSSVSSVADVFSTMTILSAATTAEDVGSVLDNIVADLLKDNGIANIFSDGFDDLGVDRFERNLRRLLKHFSNDLKRRVTQADERSAAIFLRRRSDNLARLVRDAYFRDRAASRKPAIIPEWLLKETKFDRSPKIATLDHEIDATPGEDDEDDDLLDADPDMDTERGFEALQRFFVNGEGLEEFREGLIDFVVPHMAKVHQARYQVSDGDVTLYLQKRYERRKATAMSVRNIQPPFGAGLAVSKIVSLQSSALTSVQAGMQAFRRYIRPTLQPGCYRAEWVCECGEMLWADFAEGQTWPMSELKPLYMQG